MFQRRLDLYQRVHAKMDTYFFINYNNCIDSYNETRFITVLSVCLLLTGSLLLCRGWLQVMAIINVIRILCMGSQNGFVIAIVQLHEEHPTRCSFQKSVHFRN